MDTEKVLQETAKLLLASTQLLCETRQSIERCEALPKLDSLVAIKYKKPLN